MPLQVILTHLYLFITITVVVEIGLDGMVTPQTTSYYVIKLANLLQLFQALWQTYIPVVWMIAYSRSLFSIAQEPIGGFYPSAEIDSS